MNTKTCILVTAIAGLASSAVAQESFSLSIVGMPTTVDLSGGSASFEFDVVGDASVGTHMLGGSFAIETNSNWVLDMSWSSASWDAFPTDGGDAGNGNYNQVIFGQLVIPGVPPFDVPAAGSELGSVIGTFSVTLYEINSGRIDFNIIEQSPFSLEVLDIDTGETYQSSSDTLTLNGASIIVPAPAGLALLGVSGLICGRRRR